MYASGALSGGDQSYWIQLLIKISILGGWFSTYLRQYARLIQEHYNDAAEERRLRAATLGTDDSSSSPPGRDAGQPQDGPKTFPQFGRLPGELRQQIWAEALPDSRVLMLQLPRSQSDSFTSFFFPTTSKNTPIAPVKDTNVWTCTAKIPSILHVSSEARAIALKHYRLGLAPGGSEARIYVDFSRDVIGLSDDMMRSPVGRNLWRLTDDIRLARHLALGRRGSVGFLESRQCAGKLESTRSIAIVDSMLWAGGMVPRVAQMDWAYWIRTRCARGEAVWCIGGPEADGSEGTGSAGQECAVGLVA